MSTFNCKCHWCGADLIRRVQSKSVLMHFCDRRTCKAEYQKTKKPVSKEWLEQKYLMGRLDCAEIGLIVSRDSKSVWNWLKDFGIPTRPRGTGMSQEKLAARPVRDRKKNVMRPPKTAKRKPERDQNAPNHFKGRKHTPEAIARISEGVRRGISGKPNPFKGRRHTAESKAKMSATQKKVMGDPAMRKRLSEISIAQNRRPYKTENGPPMKGKRGVETSNWKGGITPERQAFYSSPEWKRAAKFVKKRDQNSCQRCEKEKIRCDGQSFDIHHIVSFEYVPLRADVSNLVYLCEECHYWVHSNQNVDKEFIKERPDVG